MKFSILCSALFYSVNSFIVNNSIKNINKRTTTYLKTNNFPDDIPENIRESLSGNSTYRFISLSKFKLLPDSELSFSENASQILHNEFKDECKKETTITVNNNNDNDIYTKLKFRNLNELAKSKFLYWMTILPTKNLCVSDKEELNDFMEICIKSDYVFLCTNNELINYCVSGNLKNDILIINGIFRNYSLTQSVLTFHKIKPKFIEYLKTNTSNIVDIDYNDLINTRYRRYIMEEFYKLD
jgi:hypothetical protein